MSSKRRAIGRWRATVVGITLAVFPFSVTACGSDGGQQQPSQNQPDENENEPEENEPEENEPDES